MSEKQQKILYMCTCGGEDAEKASICIGLANAALALEEDVTLVLMGKSVYLAQKDMLIIFTKQESVLL